MYENCRRREHLLEREERSVMLGFPDETSILLEKREDGKSIGEVVDEAAVGLDEAQERSKLRS